MIKQFTACLIMILSYVSYNAFGGGKDKVNVNCYNGKWRITSVKYQRPTGLIIIQKKAREEAGRLSEQLGGGTITFMEGKKVTFTPSGDTTVYKGEVEIQVQFEKQQSGAGPNGNTYYRATAEAELQIKFTGEGAKYNFDMVYYCPKKNKPGFSAVNFADNIAYEFVRTTEQ